MTTKQNIASLVTALTIGAGVGAQTSCMPGCSSEEDAIQAAQSAGWSDVAVVGNSYFFTLNCSDGEMAYSIEGINPGGQRAEATVCCGHTNLKGCTIRY